MFTRPAPGAIIVGTQGPLCHGPTVEIPTLGHPHNYPTVREIPWTMLNGRRVRANPVPAHAGTSFTVFAYNAHLAGQTGHINGQPTGLNLLDDERCDKIIEAIRRINADSVLLSEVQCNKLRARIVDALQDLYPHSVYQDQPKGIEYIAEQQKRRFVEKLLRQKAPQIVHSLGGLHYGGEGTDQLVNLIFRGALHCLGGEQGLMKLIKSVFNLQEPAWGDGLLGLFKHPSEGKFVPFQSSHGLDTNIGKGVWTVITKQPKAPPVATVFGHLQEGVVQSPGAFEASKAQFRQLKGEIQVLQRKGIKIVFAGDFNIREGQAVLEGGRRLFRNDAEFDWLHAWAGKLGLQDSFRAVHPNPKAAPGYTYTPRNPFAEALLGSSEIPHHLIQERLDYLLCGTGLWPEVATVLRSDFYGLSDHFPILVRLFHLAEKGRRSIRPSLIVQPTVPTFLPPVNLPPTEPPPVQIYT